VTRPFHWIFVVVAALAAVGSILGRTELGVAVPLAAVAVIAAGVALFDAVRRAPSATRTRVTPEREPPRGVRPLFLEGRTGREEILHLLDRLDRRGAHPELPVRPSAEVRRIVSLPLEEFRRHVASRLDEIEKAP